MARFDVILFDIGGVLVELGGVALFQQWTHGRLGEKELWRRWLNSPAVHAYERGTMPMADFARCIVSEFELSLAPEEFIAAFGDFVRRPLPGVMELLPQLRAGFKLATLSNTNAIHWRKMETEMRLLRLFHHHFPSHLTGRLKPEPDAYRHAMDQLGYPAHRILYFDDLAVNVDSARAVGLVACQVPDMEGVKTALCELDILPRESAAPISMKEAP